MNKKPNILLITADQLRRDALGAYGNRIINTRNLDALASEGIIFDNHVTQNPVCMPSRWSIFTGRYPSCHGVKDNGCLYKETETTLARALRDAGYRTQGIGKMHLTPALGKMNGEDEDWPADAFGFKEHHVSDDGKKGEYLSFLKRNNPSIYEYVLRQGEEKVEEDLKSAYERTFEAAPQIKKNDVPPELHQTSWIADRTIEAIDKTDDSPFFIWCSFVDPHHPFDPPEPYASMYDRNTIELPIRKDNELDDKPRHFAEMAAGFSPGNEKYDLNTITPLGWKDLKARYYGMVSLIDYNIGRIMSKLTETGKSDNTIIVFTSDHGELLGDHGLLFKGPFHYDCLIRVPLIVKFGKIVEGGSRIAGFSKHIDLLPTVLELAGFACPPGVQGKSLSQALLSGETGQNSAIVEHRCGDWGLNLRTIREHDWRLTYYAGLSFGELYDMNNDPREFRNLWNVPEYRRTRERLVKRLLDSLILNDDPLPKRKSRY